METKAQSIFKEIALSPLSTRHFSAREKQHPLPLGTNLKNKNYAKKNKFILKHHTFLDYSMILSEYNKLSLRNEGSIFQNEQRKNFIKYLHFFFLYNMTTFCSREKWKSNVWALSTEITQSLGYV